MSELEVYMAGFMPTEICLIDGEKHVPWEQASPVAQLNLGMTHVAHVVGTDARKSIRIVKTAPQIARWEKPERFTYAAGQRYLISGDVGGGVGEVWIIVASKRGLKMFNPLVRDKNLQYFWVAHDWLDRNAVELLGVFDPLAALRFRLKEIAAKIRAAVRVMREGR